MTRPKTLAQVKRHPAVESVSIRPDEEVRYWIYLRVGFCAASDPAGRIHQGNGRTLKEAIADTFPVLECRCDDCER